MNKYVLGLMFCVIMVSIPTYAQRNVLLIIADDLGSDYLGFYDHKDTVDVPNIRKLLRKGVKFTNAASNPVCSSTRAGILTGRYSFRTGVGNIVGGIGGSGPLDVAEMTIPRMLNLYKPNGIAKANIGKWHLQSAMPSSNLNNPNIMGYDHFEGNFIGALTSYTNWTKVKNGVSSTVTAYATTETTNNAISWVKSQDRQKPFFLWLAYNAPHSPYHLPPKDLHNYDNLSGTQQDIMSNPKLYFKAMLQSLDTEIGRLFDSLSVNGRMDSTDVIFIGDNGNTKQTAQIADTDRAKGTIYEYGVDVPFIVSGPSVVNPGRTSNALVNTADLFATIIELFGYSNWQSQISASQPVDAKSILPIIKNQATDIRPWLFVEMFKITPDEADGKAIRSPDYKLFQFDDGHQEFYHLSIDPNETLNLLNTTMTDTDKANYLYLCSEMSILLNKPSLCSPDITLNLTSFITAKNVACYGQSTGNISVNVVGGLSPYTYKWENGTTTQNRTNLAAGTYTITITDALAKTSTRTINITQPEAINLFVQSTASTDSNNNGTASATVTGGTPPYSFEWSNGAIGNQVNGLSGGTYMVVITDAHNCSETKSVVVDIINATRDQIPDENSFVLSPNPANQRIFVTLLNTNINPYYITITNTNGKVMTMLPRPQLSTGIDISQFPPGAYFLQLTDDKTKKVITKKFIRS
ncbi:MAG: sulfatase-like hydrolase/transferase [Saprospiraceae bacterium]|nr:sulfatase-like hydrolase/transferase [Saprospiraceae bacterium]